VLARRCIQQGGVHTGFDVARQKRAENVFGARLEFIRTATALGLGIATFDHRSLERNQGSTHDFLRTCRDEPCVHEFNPINFALHEQVGHVLADCLGLLVLRRIREPGKALAQRVAAKLEIALGLATHWHDGVLLACNDIGLHFTFGGAQHTGVVAAAQTAVGGNGDVARGLLHLARLHEDGI